MAAATTSADAEGAVPDKLTRLWDDDRLVVDYVTGPIPAERLVVTFSHYGSSERNAAGYAEGFLRKRGFDVLAVKAGYNEWFQTLSLEQMAGIRATLPEYGRVATLGSDMGGYAALYFAGVLGADTVIGLSPQFSLDRNLVPDERRWAHEAGRISFKHQSMSAASYTDGTRRFVIFDPYSDDRVQIAAFRAAGVPIQTVPVLYGGHPIMATLQEIGILETTIAAFLDDTTPAIRSDVRQRRRQSPSYCFAVAMRALARHPRTADALMAQASSLSDRPDILLTYSRFCYDQQRYADALALIGRIPLFVDSDPHLISFRGHLFEMVGQEDEALRCFAIAIDRQPEFAAFYVNERRVLRNKFHALDLHNTMVSARLSKMEAEQALRTGVPAPSPNVKFFILLIIVPLVVALAVWLLARSFNLI